MSGTSPPPEAENPAGNSGKQTSFSQKPGAKQSRTDNEQDFFREAYLHKEKLIRIATIKLGNRDDAEEAVDDAIIRAAHKQEQLRDNQKLGGWLARIVVNHCNDLLRSRRETASLDTVAPFLEDHHDTSNPAEHISLIEDIEKILDIMLEIEPEPFREVLILHFYRKLSYEEMSAEIGIPEGTIKSRLNRAKTALIQEMQKEGFSGTDLERIRDLARWPEIRFKE